MTWENFRVQKRLALNPNVLEEIYGFLATIDGVKNSWQLTARMHPQTIENLTRSVIVTSTGASNRIEGNRLTDIEVESLYKKLNVKKFKARDEQEIAGYLQCLECVFKNHKELTVSESNILKLHDDMLHFSDRDSHHKGHYKTNANRVEAKEMTGRVVGVIFDPTPPFLVRKEMQELVDWYIFATQNRTKHPLILIANFIFEYLAIHPFQDGNGRTSRLLSNLMLLQQGYAFTQLVSHESIIEANKVDYYLALTKTQATWKTAHEDITPWLLFFLNVVRQQSQGALQILEGHHTESLLSEKQLAFWRWASRTEGTFSRKNAVEALGFPERTIEAMVQKFLNLKKLERLGQGRATRYRCLSRQGVEGEGNG